MLTENTKNAFLCIEFVDETRENAFENALKELASTVKERLSGTCRVAILDINNKETDIV